MLLVTYEVQPSFQKRKIVLRGRFDSEKHFNSFVTRESQRTWIDPNNRDFRLIDVEYFED